jgi:hypothetical protein
MGAGGRGGASDAAVVSGTVRGAVLNMVKGNENPIFFAQRILNH